MDLLRRTARESWDDSVFGQGGRMAFYHFLAIFPVLLVLLAITAHLPRVSGYMTVALRDLARQVLPMRLAQLLQEMITELGGNALSGVELLSVCAGALWAAFNGTWAMVYGLNRAYEVEENRSWWRLAATIIGLTSGLAVIACCAFLLMLCGAYIEAHLQRGIIALHILEWLVLIASLSLWFAVLYRFAPNLRDHEWQWSTPGAMCALVLWIAAALAARLYFNDVNNYSRSYGHLNGVVMLLIWLYVSNGAILIGGEMNSEIEKAAAGQGDGPRRDNLR